MELKAASLGRVSLFFWNQPRLSWERTQAAPLLLYLESTRSPVSKKELESCSLFSPLGYFFPLNLTPAGRTFRNRSHNRSRVCHIVFYQMMKFLKIEFACNKHSVDWARLTNLHGNRHHHSPVRWVSSFTAMRWLSSPSLNYLSDSSFRHTVEAGIWFWVPSPLFSDSYLPSVAAWLWRLGWGRRVRFHFGLISCQISSHFPFFPQICTFLPS